MNEEEQAASHQVAVHEHEGSNPDTGIEEHKVQVIEEVIETITETRVVTKTILVPDSDNSDAYFSGEENEASHIA